MNHISNIRIEPIREEYISAIVAFDEKIVKHNREKLLRLTFNEPETISRVAIDLDNGNILAYGSLRLHNAGKGNSFSLLIYLFLAITLFFFFNSHGRTDLLSK